MASASLHLWSVCNPGVLFPLDRVEHASLESSEDQLGFYLRYTGLILPLMGILTD